jgi:hypothetical protein
MRHPLRTVASVALLVIAAAAPALSQQGSTPEGTLPHDVAPVARPISVTEVTPPRSAQTPEALRQQREALFADIDKLIRLSNELKSELDAAPPNTLPVLPIKKAEEIEKLSHSIRKRLKS